MSKYPVKYVSGSKKAELNIEDMSTPHLANAWRKLSRPPHDPANDEAFRWMTEELVSRGCTLDGETGQWTFPPKPEEATS